MARELPGVGGDEGRGRVVESEGPGACEKAWGSAGPVAGGFVYAEWRFDKCG